MTKEEEIYIIQEGMKSEFWRLYTAKWAGFQELAMRSLLDPKYETRDFLAGKIRGMRDMISWPERRIKNLENGVKDDANA